jgi:hypothetical protein
MRYDGIVNEIRYYGEKSEDGRWIIPIGVDWDFTITKCSSWDEGTMDVNLEAFEVMKRWKRDYNVGWILDTMRHDAILEEPLQILKDNDVDLYGLRKNPQQDKDGNSVPKCWCIFHIDDRNVGTPVMMGDGCDRPCVDWKKVDEIMSPVLQEISDKLNKI